MYSLGLTGLSLTPSVPSRPKVPPPTPPTFPSVAVLLVGTVAIQDMFIEVSSSVAHH